MLFGNYNGMNNYAVRDPWEISAGFLRIFSRISLRLCDEGREDGTHWAVVSGVINLEGLGRKSEGVRVGIK